MKKIVFVLQLMLICQLTPAQNWFPMNVGDTWQYLENSGKYFLGEITNRFYLTNYYISNDSIIENKKYYNWTAYPQCLFRFDSNTATLFGRRDSSDHVYRMFTYPVDTSMFLFEPNGAPDGFFLVSTDTVVFNDSNLVSQKFKRSVYDSYFFYSKNLGFTKDEWSSSGWGLSNWGEKKLIQAYINGVYYLENELPQIIADPISINNTFRFIDTIQVLHNYNRLFTNPQVVQMVNFISSVIILGDYIKADSVIEMEPKNALNLVLDRWRADFQLNQNLIENGFQFRYKIQVTDKGLFPRSSFLPDTGFFYATFDTVSTNIEENFNLKNYRLAQNYPNPFNPSTSIQYAISNRQFVTLKVFDVLGKEIATLVDEEKLAGEYEIKFDAAHLPSGVYFYQLRAGDYVDSKKMIVLK